MPATPKQATASQSTLPAADVGTPLLYQCSDIGSDISPATSTLSASSATPTAPRPHGRPHKKLSKPDYSDFPVNGTPEEQEHWFKAKNTKTWRYNILTSENEAAYHERERECTSKYYYEKKIAQQENQTSGACNVTPSSSQGSSEKGDLEGIAYLDVDEPDHTKAQEQSQIR